MISFLLTNQSVQTGDFQQDRAAAEAARDTLARALLVNLATAPIATSSSGFVYRLDPELGTVSRASQSFGTFFVERAITMAEGDVSMGASATTAGYDRLDGLDLRDGSLVTTADQFRDESAPFDTDTLTLRIRTSTFTLTGAYGVTNRLEIGGALPFVTLHVEGSRLNVYRGQPSLQATGSADASGLADAAFRMKYRLASSRDAAFAVAGELRLPTGRAASLLGAGRAAVRVIAIGSFEHDRFGVHGNASLVRGGVSDEVGGSGAVTYAATPRLTISGELLLRRLTELREITSVAEPHPSIDGVDVYRLRPGTAVPVLSSAVTGVKWNAGGTWVLTGQVRWRLASGGLTARVAPTVAVDYLF